MVHIAVCRYNNTSWNELQRYTEANNIKGCMYNVPVRVTENVGLKTEIIVLEMNNDKNKIEGMGKIENYLRMDKYYKIHAVNNYNRYTYRGNSRLLRNNLSDVDYDISATGLSGGIVIDEGIFVGSNKGGSIAVSQTDVDFSQQLGRTIAGVSDIFCLAAIATTNNDDAVGSISWQEH